MSDAMGALSRNVVFKRAQRGISQADLAASADISRNTLSKIETGGGNVTVEILERLAAVLDCGIDELFAQRRAGTDDVELERRAGAPASDFVGARALLSAVDEANAARYSKAGRPKVDRRVSSRSR
jgi:transcriptional regulator with XRE-family HTH domain